MQIQKVHGEDVGFGAWVRIVFAVQGAEGSRYPSTWLWGAKVLGLAWLLGFRV